MQLLEIEKELAGAGGAEAMVRYDGILVGLESRAKDALARGLPSDDFAKCRDLPEAVTLARKLLRIQAKEGAQGN